MIDFMDLKNLYICQICHKVYMPIFRENEWLNGKPLEPINTEYCEGCKPIKVNG